MPSTVLSGQNMNQLKAFVGHTFMPDDQEVDGFGPRLFSRHGRSDNEPD